MARAKKPNPAAHDEQSADPAAEAAASDAAHEGGDEATEEAEAAPPAAVEQGNAAAGRDVNDAGQNLQGFLPHAAALDPMPTDLEGFITHCERLKQPDLVLVAVRHPDIREARHRDGTFSGFSMEPGPAPWAKWSDGSTFPA